MSSNFDSFFFAGVGVLLNEIAESWLYGDGSRF